MSRSWKILKRITNQNKASIINRGCLIFLIVFLFSASAISQLKKAPAWVLKTPITDNAYFGVGVMDMKKYPEFRAQARKLALREIVEKIYVSINSNSSLTMTYEDDEVDYLMEETVSMASSNFLTGHQKVDEWVDKRANQYYVLFKLDMVTYKENRVSYFNSFRNIIQLMHEKAEFLFEQGEASRGANKLIESIERLDEEMKYPIEQEYQLALQKLRFKSIYELERQIDQIGFNLQRKYEFKAASREPLLIENFLVNKSNDLPVNGLELELKVIQGDVFRYSFDHEHHDALSIYGMFPERRVAVIQINATLVLEDHIKKLLDSSVDNTFNSHPIVLEFVPYNISFQFDQTADSERLNNSNSINYLRRITNDLGLKEVDVAEADYNVILQRRGSLNQHERGYYYGDIEVVIQIVEQRNSREIYQYALQKTSIKVSESEEALNEAFRKSINRSGDFLQGFVTSLCALHL